MTPRGGMDQCTPRSDTLRLDTTLTSPPDGGAAHIAGAICFATHKPNPVPGWFEYHEVFHLGTVIGYVCHVVAIYLVVCAL